MFGFIFRLEVNLEKPTLFDTNIDLDLLNRIAFTLDQKVSDCTIPYLVLP